MWPRLDVLFDESEGLAKQAILLPGAKWGPGQSAIMSCTHALDCLSREALNKIEDGHKLHESTVDNATIAFIDTDSRGKDHWDKMISGTTFR